MVILMNDVYSWWRAASERHGKPESEDLQAGRYRRPMRDGTHRAVAIWIGEDWQWKVLDGDYEIDGAKDEGRLLDWQARAWSFCTAVTEAEYRDAVASGRWADHAPATPLHNQPPVGLDNIVAQLNDARDKARPIIKAGAAKSQDEADAAANLAAHIRWLNQALFADRERVTAEERSRILELEALIIEERKKIDALARPYSQPLNDAGAVYQALTRDVVGAFVIAQRRQRDEELRRARELDLAPARPQRVEPVNAGNKGQKVTAKKYWFAVVSDWSKAIDYFKESAALREFIQKLCDSQARAKHKVPIPGVEFKEDYRV